MGRIAYVSLLLLFTVFLTCLLSFLLYSFTSLSLLVVQFLAYRLLFPISLSSATENRISYTSFFFELLLQQFNSYPNLLTYTFRFCSHWQQQSISSSTSISHTYLILLFHASCVIRILFLQTTLFCSTVSRTPSWLINIYTGKYILNPHLLCFSRFLFALSCHSLFIPSRFPVFNGPHPHTHTHFSCLAIHIFSTSFPLHTHTVFIHPLVSKLLLSSPSSFFVNSSIREKTYMILVKKLVLIALNLVVCWVNEPTCGAI